MNKSIKTNFVKKNVWVLAYIAALFIFLWATFFVANSYREINKYSLEAQLPISARVQDRIGYDYYAELARSFAHGKLYLLGPYHDELSGHKNPYGNEAYNKKVIIQDAAYYKNKYYIYNGPLPAFIYLMGRVIFGHYPSDYTIALALSIGFIFLYSIFSFQAFKSTIFLGEKKYEKAICLLILFNIFYFNPISLPYTFLYMNIHGISRSLGLSLIFFPLIYLMYLVSEKNISNSKVFLLSLVASLSILCKFHFIIYVLIFQFLLFLLSKKINSLRGMYEFILRIQNKENIKLLLSILFPLSIVVAVTLLYNFFRFESFFEFGFKYQTNGLDLFNNPNQLYPAFDFKVGFAIFIEKLRAYFFAVPSYSESSHYFYPLNQIFIKPFDRYYMDSGTIGILTCMPITIIIFYHLLNLKFPFNLIITTKILFFSATCFVIFFLVPYFAATHYTQEILLGVSMLFFVVNQEIRGSLNRLSILLFLIISLIMTPFVR